MKLTEINEHFVMLTSLNDIDDWCYKNGIRNYDLRDDGTVDVGGDVCLSGKYLKYLPVQFGHITGHFDVRDNQLVTLRGIPSRVGATLYMPNNKLKTLDFLPEEIGGGLGFADNFVESLEGISKKLKKLDGSIFWTWNPLKSHCIEALLIPGFRKFYIPQNIIHQEEFTKQTLALNIINTYVGKPNQIFDCQAELIDADLEEYAKL